MTLSIIQSLQKLTFKFIDAEDINYRHYLLNFTIGFYALAFAIVFAVSLLRVTEIGWQENNAIHAIIVLLTGCLFLTRKYASYLAKVSLLIMIAYIIGITNTYQLGLTPASYLYYAISIMLSATFLSMKSTTFVLILVIITQFTFMYLTSTQVISYEISPLVPINNFSFWITHLIAFIILISTPLMTLGWLNARFKLSQTKLQESNRVLLDTKNKLELLATKDELTDLPNRRAFISYSQSIFNKFKRNKSNFSVLMMDLDYFKKINDTYGHAAGDKVLIAVAKVFMSQIREYDIVARTGGEEFIAILSDITPEKSKFISERIRHAIRDTNIEIEGKYIQVTISIGLAHADSSDRNFDDILKRADQAVYLAKRDGRDCVVQMTR